VRSGCGLMMRLTLNGIAPVGGVERYVDGFDVDEQVCRAPRSLRVGASLRRSSRTECGWRRRSAWAAYARLERGGGRRGGTDDVTGSALRRWGERGQTPRRRDGGLAEPLITGARRR
jgi:hypothetical protein